MDHQFLLTTSTTTSTMTSMALDSIQTTQTMLNTSLGTKGSQKSSFLDIFSHETNSNDPNSSVITPPVKSGFFDDILHKEDRKPNPLSPFPAPNPSQNSPYPSAASIAGETARLKNLLNFPPVQNRISPHYFFQACTKPIMTNKQVITTLCDLQFKAQRQER